MEKLTPEQRDELSGIVAEVVQESLDQFGEQLISKCLRPLADELIGLSHELRGQMDRLRELCADLVDLAAKEGDDADWWKGGPPDEAG